MKKANSNTGRKARFNEEERIKIIEETRLPGNSIASVAMRYGIATSQLYFWRKQLKGRTTSHNPTVQTESLETLILRNSKLEEDLRQKNKVIEGLKEGILISDNLAQTVSRNLKGLIRQFFQD